jgi:hypothetical protein
MAEPPVPRGELLFFAADRTGFGHDSRPTSVNRRESSVYFPHLRPLAFCSRDSKIIFNFVCPFSRTKTLSPVKAVIKAATLKEKPP